MIISRNISSCEMASDPLNDPLLRPLFYLFNVGISVWGSDDDFACSSGSESRESSIGHDSRGRLVVPRPPGGTPKNRRSKPPRTQSTTSPPDPYAQLSLEIPGK